MASEQNERAFHSNGIPETVFQGAILVKPGPECTFKQFLTKTENSCVATRFDPFDYAIDAVGAGIGFGVDLGIGIDSDSDTDETEKTDTDGEEKRTKSHI